MWNSFEKYLGNLDKFVVPASEVDSPGTYSRSHPAAPVEVPEEDEEKLVNETDIGCKRSFEPTCDIYSYVRFWNRKFISTDCQQSPLRPTNVERVPLAERKYLLFEPDRGTHLIQNYCCCSRHCCYCCC